MALIIDIRGKKLAISKFTGLLENQYVIVKYVVTFLHRSQVYICSLKQACVIAFTSEFIPREVYRFNHGDGTLDGYIDFSLSHFNVSDFETINGRVSKPDDESHPLFGNVTVEMCR